MSQTDVPPALRPAPREPERIVVPSQSRGVLGTVVQAVVLLLLLSILAAVVLVLFAIVSMLNLPSQVAGGVNSQFGNVAAQASRAAVSAQQALQNATDPNHPPNGLSYDNELASLQLWHVGDGLPGGTDYVLTLQAIKRREGADSPDTAQYGVIHAQLRQPRETRLFGQLVRSDADPRDHSIYKGETFRIGRALYRLNWISQDENALAAGVLRHPDAVTAPLKFDYP